MDIKKHGGSQKCVGVCRIYPNSPEIEAIDRYTSADRCLSVFLEIDFFSFSFFPIFFRAIKFSSINYCEAIPVFPPVLSFYLFLSFFYFDRLFLIQEL